VSFVLIALVLLVALVVVACLVPGSTSPITDARGRPLPGSIAALEMVTLGGVEQSLLIRGRNVANPVLLFLHGGPGTSELGLVRAYNLSALERHFTVVVWDQRGAGKSFAALRPVSGMTIEQLISDTRELTVLLCHRFAQQKIYLVGHSWGSALGALTVKRYPEWYHAFVGIGQAVNMQEGERLSYQWTLAQAEQAHDARSVARLKQIGAPPYSGDVRSKVIAQRAILARYGGEVHGNPRGGLFITLRCLLKATEYSWPDRINVFRGIFATMRLMWPQILSIDLMEQAPELKVPVYFLEGRHDQEAPSVLAEQYFQVLRAPRKTLVWFEKSAHLVNVEEAEAFNQFFIERLLPQTHRPLDGTGSR
jgi:pimeloyl-ACP methyl ester carboxylesterase